MDEGRASLFMASPNPQQTPPPKKNVARKPSARKAPTKKTPTAKTPTGKTPPGKTPTGKPISKKSENLEEKYKLFMQSGENDKDGALFKKLMQGSSASSTPEPTPQGSKSAKPPSPRQQQKKKPPAKKTPKAPPPGLDMKDRDPYDLNSHVRATFGDVIGEPDGAHSDDCIWVNSYKGFDVGRVCCYTCLTYVCAIPLAFCWGCQFACITFMHIWSITPLYRVFRMNCDCAGKFFSTIVHCWCDPCYEALALMFTKIYVHIVNTSTSYTERTYKGMEELVMHRTMPNKQSSSGSMVMGRQGGDASRVQLEFDDIEEEEDREYDNIPMDSDPSNRV